MTVFATSGRLHGGGGDPEQKYVETSTPDSIAFSGYGMELAHDPFASPDMPCLCSGCVQSRQWQSYYANKEPELLQLEPLVDSASSDEDDEPEHESAPAVNEQADLSLDSHAQERLHRLPTKLRGLGGCFKCGDGQPNDILGEILYCDTPKCGTGNMNLIPSFIVAFVCFSLACCCVEWHQLCIDPPLFEIPVGAWHCRLCTNPHATLSLGGEPQPRGLDSDVDEPELADIEELSDSDSRPRKSSKHRRKTLESEPDSCKSSKHRRKTSESDPDSRHRVYKKRLSPEHQRRIRRNLTRASLNKASLKPLPPLSASRPAVYSDLDEDSDDWGSQAEDEDEMPTRQKAARKDRPENIGTAEQTEQYWQAELERLSRLHLDPNRFMEPISAEQQKRSVAAFREMTSLPYQQRLVCCVCGEYKPGSVVSTFRLPGAASVPGVVTCSTFLPWFICCCISQSTIKSKLLSAMQARLGERTKVPAPTLNPSSLCAQHLKDLALEIHHGAIDQDLSTLQMCSTCEGSLGKESDKPPRCSLANSLSRGDLPPQLADLTWTERRLIALFRASIYILTIQGEMKFGLKPTDKVRSTLAPDDKEHKDNHEAATERFQWKLRGHCVGMLCDFLLACFTCFSSSCAATFDIYLPCH